MKEEKKVNAAEEVKKDVKAEEGGVKLIDEELEQVTGGAIEDKNAFRGC